MSGTKILQPSVSLTLANADLAVSNVAQKVLLIGQMISGTATSEELQTNLSSSGAPENALFGEDSMIAAMVRAFKSVNPTVRVDAIAVDDHASGVPRVVEFTLVGTASADGTITVVAGSEVNHKYEVTIPDTTDETDSAALLVAAVNADSKVPFTAANVAGVVQLTANNDGAVANDRGVEVIVNVAGITIATVADDTAGSQDPVLTTVLDAATERYQAIVWPWADISDLQTYLAARLDADNIILDGVGFNTLQDSHATLLSTLAGAGYNDQTIVIFAEKQESFSLYKGPSMNEPSYWKSAVFAGIRAMRLSDGASIASLLTSSASLDQFGGPALASLPYFNTPLSAFPAIPAGRGWTDSEIEQLTTAGGSVMGMNFGGTSALVGEVVTTYKTDPASNVDPTWKFLNYVDTASNIREYMFNNLKSRFAQTRLTEGAVTRGRDMANEGMIRAFVEKLYQDLSGADFVLVQAGEEAIVFFKERLDITIDLAAGSVTMTMQVPIVTQLRTIIGTIKIAFSTTS